MNENFSYLFVSHVSEDRVVASEIVAQLEGRGLKCWIAPRDVTPGKFDDVIVDAIDRCSAFLLIFSDKSNDNEYISRELTVAGEAGKTIIPVRIENANPRGGLRMRLTNLHRIDAFPAQGAAIDELERRLKTLRNDPPPPPPPPPQPPRWRWAAIGLAAATIVAALCFWLLYEPPNPTQSGQDPTMDWAKNPPDQAYCFQRRNSPVVTPGKFLVRCFLTYELCEEFRIGDNGEKTDCRFVTGLRWTDAKKDQRPTPTWHQYSNSVIPPPFPGF